MNKETLAAAFNEWMRRYEEEPERFTSEWEAIKVDLAERAKGGPLSYGQNASGYLLQLLDEDTSCCGGSDETTDRL